MQPIRTIKNILISQPVPSDYEKSPYKELADKFNLNITFKKVIKIEKIPVAEFKKSNIDILSHKAVIFNSRHAADNYFRIVNELNIKLPIDIKYFCISESIAYYAQKYVTFRKRKFFLGDQTTDGLMNLIRKHKRENFLFPLSEESTSDLLVALEKSNITFTKAILYRTVPDKISKEIDIEKYDMIVLFSPVGVQSIISNFPQYQQKDRLIAAFGKTVWNAVKESGLRLSLPVPTPTSNSMTSALSEFITDYQRFGGNLAAIEEKFCKQREQKIEETTSVTSRRINDISLKQKTDRIFALKVIEEKKRNKKKR
ncbi:MAG: uroporphyrinogen-III synthase [Bacteroidales bacterium]|jgi:uroporphyrinogen-III synthase|nr:uroporphyrinogen-III synthase [Bacteroidales bacterium]